MSTVTEYTINVETALKIADKSGGSIPIIPITEVGKTQICYNTDSSKLAYIKTNDGSTNIVTNLNIYGSQFQYVEALGPLTTTSTIYANRLTLTTPTIPAGTYRVGFYYQWNKLTSGSFLGRLLIDGVVSTNQFQQPASFVSTQRNTTSGYQIIDLTTAIHTINIQTAVSGGGTSEIRNMRIEFWRIL